MKVFAVIGYHNAGKTTLIENLIPQLLKKGYKVGYIKHDPKGHGITDKEGSDTYRISKYLKKLALLSPNKLTYWEKESKGILDVIEKFFSDCDVVILEGFKEEKRIPKIAVGEVKGENIILRVDTNTKIEDIIKVIENLGDLI
ncbi:MAG TPA: molybdopterin-guanine dinucleotide biosynthesis protein B [Aquificaceae bacterium]|nr:molybdopterin-guanine dinucleotide biosynthesis protein B [Aquificaceae bacterium]HIQ48370.1 molybdopterin-guanine dinucleotide biosynthesis protein B [Aquifex aeolicus]